MQKNLKQNTDQKGFALTWVLITVVIISILVFSVQTMMLGYHKRGN